MFTVSCFIRAMRLFTTFLFGATGEIVTEKNGHLNLGTPGIMCIGGIGGCYGLYKYLDKVGGVKNANGFLCVFIAIVCAMLFSAIAGAFYSFLTVTLRANQNITGLTITTFGVGFADYLSKKITKTGFSKVGKNYFNNLFHLADDAPDIVRMFFSYGIMVYLAILIAVLVSLLLKFTRVGLNLKAVGESPATADAAGISVVKYRYISTIIGAAIAGLGGLSFIMDSSTGMFDQASSIEALGWIAVALVICSVWKPYIAIPLSFVFAYFYTLPNFIQAANNNKELIKMIPFVLSISVLITISILGDVLKTKLFQPPASLGINYFREDR